MACFSPLAIKNDKRKSSSDYLVSFVPCGKCEGCLQARRANWSFRLQQEEKICQNSSFTTLTYNDENYPGNGKFEKKEVQKYFKRLKHKNPKLVYYCCAEYGGKFGRSHYHAIIYNCNKDHQVNQWQKGNVDLGEVTESSIHYVTGYIINENKDNPKLERPWSLMSKGIGINFITDEVKNHYARSPSYAVRFPGGNPGTLPRYYRDKIFDKNVQKQIAENSGKEMLEKMEREGTLKIIKHRSAVKYKFKKTSKSKNYENF